MNISKKQKSKVVKTYDFHFPPLSCKFVLIRKGKKWFDIITVKE